MYLKSYLQTYLKEEVEQEGLTRNLAAFARFLESASFSQAQILNIAKVAEDARVERKVVEGYFAILEDLLIAERVPVFTRRAKRKMTAHPKFFFFDCGVYQSIRPKGPLDAPEEIDGPAWETLVWQEIRAMNSYNNWEFQIFTWRTQLKQEVDLVLYGPNGLIGIEVKRTSRIRKEDLESLKLFKADYPMSRLFFVYGGTEKINIDGIEIWPLADFLRALPILEQKK